MQKPENDDWQLAAAPLATSLRMYPGRYHRVGMRSAMMNSAALCDLIAAQIGNAGRDSQKRRDAIAVAKRCGDAIMEMRDQVSVPSADAELVALLQRREMAGKTP